MFITTLVLLSVFNSTTMANSIQGIDPKTLLSNEDVIRLLIKNCHDTCNNIVNETTKIEREQKLNNQENLVKRISDLEEQFDITTRNIRVSVDTIEDVLANINLKTMTSSLYYEQLLYNLKHALYNTLSTLSTDKYCPCST